MLKREDRPIYTAIRECVRAQLSTEEMFKLTDLVRRYNLSLEDREQESLHITKLKERIIVLEDALRRVAADSAKQTTRIDKLLQEK